MVQITCWCPECGRRELSIDEVTLVVNPHDLSAESSWYLFDCTGCGYQRVKPAPRSVVSALTAVQVVVWQVPAEVQERGPALEKPPLSIDDLLDAVLWLGTHDVQDNAMHTTPTGDRPKATE